ncbi:unnamed protein product [Caenorhabditis bovis]|uniref:Uncharacterized protein n=1 Tax=Caenorhabditis bovis TaxID=2654633 RepID=A0A8S1F0R0_9PELO|nr:unnamed protein product [Caenorhabditis bovis]
MMASNIGTPFPQHVQKAPGQTNKYVALWYRHGKPVMGRAWNDSGVVQCTFVVDGKVFSGGDVGGQIQLLKFDVDSEAKRFHYDWVPYAKARSLSSEGRFEMVRCGTSTPCYWTKFELLGNLDTAEKVANFVEDNGNHKTTRDVSDLHVLCKIDGRKCSAEDHRLAKVKKPLCINEWEDYNWGSAWPSHRPVLAAPPNASQEQFVALWYRHGKPIMGRAWPVGGKIEASFIDANREFTGPTVGSLQLLIKLPATTSGYEYVWLPYEQAADFQDKNYMPVHMSYVAPALFSIENAKFLGCVDMKNERAGVVVKGKIVQWEGGQVKTLLVLCRKEHEESMLV